MISPPFTLSACLSSWIFSPAMFSSLSPSLYERVHRFANFTFPHRWTNNQTHKLLRDGKPRSLIGLTKAALENSKEITETLVRSLKNIVWLLTSQLLFLTKSAPRHQHHFLHDWSTDGRYLKWFDIWLSIS